MRTIVCFILFGLIALPVSGQFGAPQEFQATSHTVRAVTASDLDGDGDQDVLWGGDPGLFWAENIGGGVFAAGQEFQPTSFVEEVAASDLDGDGDQDVLWTRNATPSLFWAENIGGGVFAAAQEFQVTSHTVRAVTASDLDGDGDQDVLWGGDPGLFWAENIGGGVFAAGQEIQLTSFVEGVAASDLDGDGDQDVLCNRNATPSLVWAENLGGGVFAAAQEFQPTTGWVVHAVTASDLDGDGDQDVLWGGGPGLFWAENLGGGVFAAAQEIQPTSFVEGVVASDLDGDGDQDVLWGRNAVPNGLLWAENLSGGAFGSMQQLITPFDWLSGFDVVDLDGDGDGDFLANTRDSSDPPQEIVAWHENLGSNTFGHQHVVGFLPATHGETVMGADVDGDGDVDVIVDLDDDTAWWYENLSGGAFGPMQQLITPFDWLSGFDVVDLDGDGDGDFLANTRDSSDPPQEIVAWHENLGSNTFGHQHVVGFLPATHGETVMGADVDGDGDVDVIVDLDDDTAWWYENLSGGAFGPMQQLITPFDWLSGFDVVDLDGDGDGDFLANTRDSSDPPQETVAWHENLGSNTFGPQQVIGFHAETNGETVVGADVDGDGDVDVIVDLDDDTAWWYENLSSPILDCNGNGISDASDITNGTSLDTNADGIPDECQGTWLDLRNALAGTNGDPLFVGSGPLLSGAQINLAMSNTQPFAGCYLVVGFLQFNAPFKGGILVPSPDLVLPFGTDGLGGVNLPALWPDGVPPSLSAYMQFWIPDAAAVKGFAASNALSATTGP